MARRAIFGRITRNGPAAGGAHGGARDANGDGCCSRACGPSAGARKDRASCARSIFSSHIVLVFHVVTSSACPCCHVERFSMLSHRALSCRAQPRHEMRQHSVEQAGLLIYWKVSLASHTLCVLRSAASLLLEMTSSLCAVYNRLSHRALFPVVMSSASRDTATLPLITQDLSFTGMSLSANARDDKTFHARTRPFFALQPSILCSLTRERR